MGIRKIINRLFGHSDSDYQIPSSLGGDVKDKEDINLGIDARQAKDKDAASTKDESYAEKNSDNEAQDKQEGLNAPASETYNLIILDESGSMSCVRPQTISGCNETLNSIRNMAKEQPSTKQYVSIFCFDNTNSRYLFRNVPIEKARDLTTDDYKPNGCTPLYDAIGYTVTQLETLIADSGSVAVVTIITDGYENASCRWTLHSVAELIERLKNNGWVFTFIGANIDVEKAAKSLKIDSYAKFEQTNEGMINMFEQERRSRMAYNSKRFYMESMSDYMDMSNEERKEMLCKMNINYFVDKERVAPDFIKTLADNEIFVFGSNTSGQHDGGAALYAKDHFGAEDGKPEGPQGKSYAIPTQGNTSQELREAILRFTLYVAKHPQYRFMLSAVGCGSAGYNVEQIAPLFRQAYSFGNVYVPANFLPFMPT